MIYLLDTNVCIDYLNGRYPGVVERIKSASPEDIGTSSVVAAELRYGAEKSTRKELNHCKLDVFLSEIEIVDFDLEAASMFGRLRSQLESRGELIGPYDMMIAAHVLTLGCVLVSDNVQEFRRVTNLEIQNWRRTDVD